MKISTPKPYPVVLAVFLFAGGDSILIAQSSQTGTPIALAEHREATPIEQLPYRIFKPGVYRLATDLVYRSPHGAAITVETDDVTLDLGGKTLSGSAGAGTSALGVLAVDRSNIKVTNGRLTGFYFAIDIRATNRDAEHSQGHEISGIIADRNWYFAIRLVGSKSEIRNCTITETGGSSKPGHTIPHGVRLFGPDNTLKKSCIRNLKLRRTPDGKGEIVGVHFDGAKNCVLEGNLIADLADEADTPIPPEDRQERRFGVWVNAGPKKSTFLHVRNNVFYGFTVPLAFTPGSDGLVTENSFTGADAKPIRGKPASQLDENVVEYVSEPPDCPAR